MVTTAGIGTSTTSTPPSISRWQTTTPPSSSMPRRDGDARQVEQLGEHRADLLLVVVHGLHAEQHEVRARVADLGRQRARGGQSVQRRLPFSSTARSAPMASAAAQLLARARIAEADTTTSPAPAPPSGAAPSPARTRRRD
jgi:hypothetical protein